MKRLLLFITICISSVSFGQVPVIEWHNTYDNGDSIIDPVSMDSIWISYEDAIRSIDETSDGGYIVAGFSVIDFIASVAEAWVVKLDNGGNLIWEKSIGSGGFDTAYDIQQTTDGGYILTGYGGVIKLDNIGNISWQINSNSLGVIGRAIQQTTDGGYILAGYTQEDYWIVKLDAIGNITWQKSFGGSGSDRAGDIQQTTDGGYIVTGHSDSNDGDVTGNHGNYDYWVVKLDNSGNLIWEKSLGGSSEDLARSVAQTEDGGYIVAGYSMSNNGDISSNISAEDYWIVKLDAVGNLTWEKSLGGSLDDDAYSIQQTTDGGFIVTGRSKSNDGDVIGHNGESDCWVVKLDATGNLNWQKPLGGGEWDYGYDIKQTSDGGYIVAATLSDGGDGSDFSVFKLGPDLTSLEELYPNQPKELIKIVNLLGQEVEYTTNTVLIYQYSDGTSEKVFTIED